MHMHVMVTNQVIQVVFSELSSDETTWTRSALRDLISLLQMNAFWWSEIALSYAPHIY